MSLIIGLGSKARVGKDYAVKELSKYFDVERVSFADEMKKDLNVIFKPIHPEVDFTNLDADPELKEYWRPVLVAYAERLKEFDKEYWIKRALEHRELTHEITIIPDCRFPQEVTYIQNLGGIYIDIDSDIPPANEIEALNSPKLAGMADFRVRNDFTDQFIVCLREIITNVRSGRSTFELTC